MFLNPLLTFYFKMFISRKTVIGALILLHVFIFHVKYINRWSISCTLLMLFNTPMKSFFWIV